MLILGIAINMNFWHAQCLLIFKRKASRYVFSSNLVLIYEYRSLISVCCCLQKKSNTKINREKFHIVGEKNLWKICMAMKIHVLTSFKRQEKRLLSENIKVPTRRWVFLFLCENIVFKSMSCLCVSIFPRIVIFSNDSHKSLQNIETHINTYIRQIP